MHQCLNYIYRTSIPNKLDTAEFKTICKVTNPSDNSEQLYIQMSKDAEHPNWGKIASFIKEEKLSKLIDLIE